MSCGNEASPWTHGFSPEGHAYYFNTVTGESSWTAPPEHRSSEVTMPLTPSMGAMPSMGGTTDVSDLFGAASDGDSELFGAAGAPVETPFTGAIEPDACAGFGAGGATEASSDLFSCGGAPDSAAFASAPAPAASELFGSAPDTGPGLFASAPAPAASELFGSAPDTGPGLFASAPAPAASELFGSAPDTRPGLFASAPAPAASELFGSAPDTGPGLFASAPAPAASELFGSAPDTGPGLFAAAAPYDAARVAFVADPSEALVPPTPEVGQGYVAHRVQQLVAPAAAAPAAAASVPPGDAVGTDPSPDQGPWMFGYSEQARRPHPRSRPDPALPDPLSDPTLPVSPQL